MSRKPLWVRKEYRSGTGNYSMRNKTQNEDARNRKDYLEGLRRFQKRGIPILIDGKICREAEWNRIFEVGEDGGFYMGDYVCSEKDGLKEIRFDKVYLSVDEKRDRQVIAGIGQDIE